MKIAILIVMIVAISHTTTGAAIRPELGWRWTKAITQSHPLQEHLLRQKRVAGPDPKAIATRVLLTLNPLTAMIPLVKNILQIVNGQQPTIL